MSRVFVVLESLVRRLVGYPRIQRDESTDLQPEHSDAARLESVPLRLNRTGGEPRRVLWLAEHRDTWMVRRTGSIAFDGERTLERSTMCEAVLDRTVLAGLPRFFGSELPFPIADMSRLPPRHVRVSADQRPVPVLLRSQERDLLCDALLAGIPDEVLADADMTSSPDVEALRAVARRVLSHELDPAMHDALSASDTEFAARLTSQDPVLFAEAGDFRNIRIIMALIRSRLGTEDSEHLLIEETHSESVIIRRAGMLRFARAWWHRDDARRSTYARWRIGTDGRELSGRSIVVADGSAMHIEPFADRDADRQYRRIWRPLLALIPDTYVAYVAVEDFLHCASYHLQLQSPLGTYIDDASLRLLNDDTHPDAAGEAVVEASELIIILDDDYHHDAAHLHFNRKLSRRHAADDEYYGGTLRIVLRPTYHGGLRAAFWISLLSTITLWTLTLSLGWRAENFDCWAIGCHVSVGGTRQTDALVTLLVLSPSIALAVILRQDEHDLTKRIQVGYRSRVFSTAALLYLAGLAFAIDVKRVFWLLLICSVASTTLLVRTAMSTVFSRYRIKKLSYGRAAKESEAEFGDASIRAK